MKKTLNSIVYLAVVAIFFSSVWYVEAATSAGDGVIEVTSPTAGAILVVGQKYSIDWTSKLVFFAASKVSIELIPPRPTCLDIVPACQIPELEAYSIASGILDSGKYSWTVPTNLPAAYKGQMQIRVSYDGISASGLSGFFEIQNENKPAEPSMAISTDAVLKGVAQKFYRAEFSVSGGLAPYTWDIIDGDLPPGVFLFDASSTEISSSSVIISGNPTKSGKYVFTLRVRDNSSSESFSTFSILINPAVKQDPCQVMPTGGAGLLVRASSGAVHLIMSGHKYTFSSAEEFYKRGFRFDQIHCQSSEAFEKLPTSVVFVRPSGVNFKYKNSSAIYYLTMGHCKSRYLSVQSMKAWNVSYKDIISIPDSEQYPDCGFVFFPDNTLVKAKKPAVYVVQQGKLFGFSSVKAVTRRGFKIGSVVVISGDELKRYSFAGTLD